MLITSQTGQLRLFKYPNEQAFEKCVVLGQKGKLPYLVLPFCLTRTSQIILRVQGLRVNQTCVFCNKKLKDFMKQYFTVLPQIKKKDLVK